MPVLTINEARPMVSKFNRLMVLVRELREQGQVVDMAARLAEVQDLAFALRKQVLGY